MGSTFWGQAGADLAAAIKEQARETLEEKKMGPIERELRDADARVRGWCVRMPDETLRFAIEASRGMGLEILFLTSSVVDADVLSEAIEAAEALGL